MSALYWFPKTPVNNSNEGLVGANVTPKVKRFVAVVVIPL